MTAVMNLGRVNTLEAFWRNLYLRGQVILDISGVYAANAYLQPWTQLPASRAFVIGVDQNVELVRFTHDPELIIGTIHDLLAATFREGDFDGDGDVDLDDFNEFRVCFTGPGAPDGIRPECGPGDLDESGAIDCLDWDLFGPLWTDPGDPPPLARCAPVELTIDQADVVEWQADAAFDSWNLYRGDLLSLRGGGPYTDAPGSNPLVLQLCELPDDSTADADTPPPGGVSYFLVTGVAEGIEGTLGRNGSGERTNDNPCIAAD